jgi:predicted P-loop ATPase
MSRRKEQYFSRYGRLESEEPRQCVFVITINESIYLFDTTGNRRYWPVLVGVIDLAALKQDRDQLWAEAVVRYRRGESRWPSPEFEAKYIKPQQERREAPPHPWEEPIAKFLFEGIKDPSGRVIYHDRFTIGQVLDQAGRGGLKDMGQRTRADSLCVANILERLQCTRATDREGNQVKVNGQVVWCRP